MWMFCYRWRWWMGGLAALLLVATASMWSERIEIAAQAMVRAPNQGQSAPAPAKLGENLRAPGVSQALQITVGTPPTILSVWIVDPPWIADTNTDPASGTDSAVPTSTPSSTDAPAVAPRDARPRPRGTVLYLHGIYARKQMMLETAISHAARGYRGILVDSRGHGESNGEWITYGAQETRDYSELLDELERRGILDGKLAVYGCSYGAGVAVQLAGRDPRVAAAIALAPFSSMHDVVHARAHSLWLDWIFNKADIDAAIARAGQLAGFDPAAADGVAAMRSRPVRLLVIHGRLDTTIPCAEGIAVHAAADPASKLVIIDRAQHDNWTHAGNSAIWTESTAWLDRWIGK
ncbi:MAG: alpha/beta fold hydrolase [Phycisphaerae bacterium]